MVTGRSTSGQGSAAVGSMRGTVTLELAVLAPLLIIVLFGCMEASLLGADMLTLNDLGRQASRIAAKGATPEEIDATIDAAQTRLDTLRLGRSYEYAPYDPDTGTWGQWQPLGSIGPFNTASDRDRVRVSLSYAHHPVGGRLFDLLLEGSEDDSVVLRSNMIVRRE